MLFSRTAAVRSDLGADAYGHRCQADSSHADADTHLCLHHFFAHSDGDNFPYLQCESLHFHAHSDGDNFPYLQCESLHFHAHSDDHNFPHLECESFADADADAVADGR